MIRTQNASASVSKLPCWKQGRIAMLIFLQIHNSDK